MAPRPKNPPPDRRQEILEAALRVFAAKGYQAATNAEIAREAGVTAAALYYYFPSKADMFQAAILERRGSLMPNIQQLGEQLREMPPETVLPMMAQFMTYFFADERTQAILRIVLSEGPRNPELVGIWQEQAIGAMAPIILQYLQEQMDRGRLRQMDPRLVGVQLIGPVFMTMLIRDFLRIPMGEGLTNEMLVQGLTEGVLKGLILRDKE
ncbi:MAG TPA: TetR/AcrR family transcriptional regulator [Symbiobacteriaceae bacterium]|nr:TetR/AcrR family transcriptional regulator [Symbiobacteriaceae bacterium]